MTAYAICRTCPEVTTGVLDTSKGFLLAASSNHHHCDVKPIGDPTTLSPPIRNTILRLGASAPLRDSDITMFKLGLDLEDEWARHRSTAPAVANTSTTSAAAVPELVASTRSPRASAPTSATSAPDEPSLFDLLDSGVTP